MIVSRPRDQLVRDAADARIRSYRRGYEGVVALPTLLVYGLVSGMWSGARGRRIQITVEAIRGCQNA